MARKIFINYRRGETLKDAQHLATLLARSFGSHRIFLDLQGIDGGENYVHTLARQVAASDVVIALIGKNWIDLKDEEGNRRLDNPNDFVRFEIAQALQRDIPVLPVLLDGAPVPRITQLPQDMMALALFQAMPLRAESVVQDAEAIARRLKIMLDKRRSRGVSMRVTAIGAVLLMIAGLMAGPFVLSRLGLPLIGVSPPDAARERIEKLEQELVNAKANLTKTETRIADLQQQRDAIGNELDRGRVELAELGSTLKATQGDRDVARRALSSAEKKAADSQRQLDAVASENAQSRAETERLKTSLQSAVRQRDEAIAGLQRERDQALTDLASTNTRANDLQKQLDVAKSEVASRPDTRGNARQAAIEPIVDVIPADDTPFSVEPARQVRDMLHRIGYRVKSHGDANAAIRTIVAARGGRDARGGNPLPPSWSHIVLSARWVADDLPYDPLSLEGKGFAEVTRRESTSDPLIIKRLVSEAISNIEPRVQSPTTTRQ